ACQLTGSLKTLYLQSVRRGTTPWSSSVGACAAASNCSGAQNLCIATSGPIHWSLVSCRRADRRTSEHEIIAHVCDRHGRTDQVEIPGAVGGFAEQHGADESPVPDHKFLVGLQTGIVEGHGFCTGCAEKVASRKNIHARYFEMRAG